MNILSSFATAFCASSVFIGALYMLCPDGTLNRSLKYVFACVFILLVVTAAMPFSDDFDIEFPDITEKNIETQKLDEYTVKYTYALALQNSGIDFEEIEVCTDKTEEGSIYISKVIIYSECEKTLIENALGIDSGNKEVEIINE